MPARRLRLKCPHIFALIAMALLVPIMLEAQTGQVTLRGTVSETVALSVLPNLTDGNLHADVISSGNSVRITLTGVGSEASVIRVPLLVRSNSAFKISAAVESKTAALTQLSVLDVRATGTLVSPQAISGLSVPREFDLRGLNKGASTARDPLEDARPFVVSGPRVSLGGTLESANNALQITVLIDLKPQKAHEWSVQVTFVGTPEQPVQ
jgi:hypothetical protein